MTLGAIAPIAGGVGGMKVGGMVAGALGMGAMASQVTVGLGYMAGSFLGQQLFPQKSQPEMPPMAGYPVQGAMKGTPVQMNYGTNKIAGQVIWMGPTQSYGVTHKASGGGKGGGGSAESTEIRYRKSFLIGICMGEQKISKAWKGKDSIDVTAFTQFPGDGVNAGLAALVGESYCDYKHLCCAFFDSYELGTSDSLPNFTFEVSWIAPVAPIVCSPSGATSAQRLYVDDYTPQFNKAAATGAMGGDCHQSSGRWVMTQTAAVGREPLIVYDRDGNDLGIKFDNTGSSDWNAHDTMMCAKFTKDGRYIVAMENRLVFNGVMWKWDSYTGALQWRKPLASLRYNWSLALDDDDNIYINGSDVGLVPSYMVLYSSNGSEVGKIADPCVGPYDHVFNRNVGTAGAILACGANVIGDVSHVTLYDLGTSTVKNKDLGLGGVGGDTTSKGALTDEGISYVTTTNGKVMKLSADLDILATVSVTNPMQPVLLPDGGVAVPWHDGAGVPTMNIYNSDLTLTNSYAVRDADNPSIVWSNYSGNTFYMYRSIGEGDDVNPVDVIEHAMTDVRGGAKFSTSEIDGETFGAIREYCSDNNFLVSLKFDTRRYIFDWVDWVCSHFGGWMVYTDGKYKMGAWRNDPVGNRAITQNDLVVMRSDDPMPEGVEPPVRTKKREWLDTINRIEVTYENRSKEYATGVADHEDETDQRNTGTVRPKTVNLAGIKNATYAKKAAVKLLFDSMYRFSTFQFTTGYKKTLYEPGDVFLLSDGGQLSEVRCRITSISESKDGRNVDIEAVEDVSYMYPEIGWTAEESERVRDSAADLEDGTLNVREDLEERFIHMAIKPGGADTNGWYVYVSRDDVTYELLGRAMIGGVTGGQANSIGSLTTALAGGSVVSHRYGEYFKVNIGTLTDLRTDVTDLELFNNLNLARIGNEIIGWRDAEETATEGIWKVSNLIRGLYNTPVVKHSIGEEFVTLMDNFLFIARDSDVGNTLYFKVLTFYGDSVQSLSSVSAQSVTVAGEWAKPGPVSIQRIVGREGMSDVEQFPVTMTWNFCARRGGGYNTGKWGEIPWGSSTKDRDITDLRVKVLKTDRTELSDTLLSLEGYEAEAYNLVLADADRAGVNPVVVQVNPIGLYEGDSREHLVEIA